MRVSWLGSMRTALLATLARPEWWTMALAAFLVRGGIVLVLLPIVTLPTMAGLLTALSPGVEGLLLGRPSLEGAVVGSAVLALILAALAAAGMAGAWLDLALVREVAADEDVELGWAPVRGSAWSAFAIRLTAHLPTLVACVYGFARVVAVAYEEFTAPGTAGLPIADRILARVPDVVLVVVLAWLIGEAVGALAARRAAMGMGAASALAASARQVLRPRGLAVLGLSSGVLVVLGVPFLLAASTAWEHLRGYLLSDAEAVPLAAALVVLVATWVLGLAVLGAGLAWRATTWTAEVPPG